jgi:cytochrome P450 family 4
LEFRPERFADESFKNIHPYAYIPFSNGPRMCPGYKYALITLKIFLSRFIMKYHFSTSTKFEELKMIAGISLRFQENPAIVIEKRQLV